MTEQTNGFSEWCLVEVMGHQRLAGLVSEQVIGGTAFIRVDVPAVAGQPGFTRLLGGSSIYAITPTTQEIATALAASIRSQPVQRFELPSLASLPSLPAPAGGPDPEDDHGPAYDICPDCGCVIASCRCGLQIED